MHPLYSNKCTQTFCASAAAIKTVPNHYSACTVASVHAQKISNQLCTATRTKLICASSCIICLPTLYNMSITLYIMCIALYIICIALYNLCHPVQQPVECITPCRICASPFNMCIILHNNTVYTRIIRTYFSGI